jgi:hypothetical protein
MICSSGCERRVKSAWHAVRVLGGAQLQRDEHPECERRASQRDREHATTSAIGVSAALAPGRAYMRMDPNSPPTEKLVALSLFKTKDNHLQGWRAANILSCILTHPRNDSKPRLIMVIPRNTSPPKRRWHRLPNSFCYSGASTILDPPRTDLQKDALTALL